MATEKTKNTGGSLGLAATAVGAAAAGFFLFGAKGAENKVKLKSWTLKAKGEVLEHFEKAKEVSEESYVATVDKVTAKYSKLKTVGEEEALKLNKELKRHWKAIKQAAVNTPKK